MTCKIYFKKHLVIVNKLNRKSGKKYAGFYQKWGKIITFWSDSGFLIIK
jgi:hypothetical protein